MIGCSINLRTFAIVVGVLWLVGTAKAERLPNVIIILADDLGYGDSSIYRRSATKTPAMERIAADGMTFTDAHSTASVCTPTRYALLTGKYNWRSG